MFVFLYMVCTYVRLGIWATIIIFVLIFLYNVCKHVRLEILKMRVCVYVYVVVES